MNYEEFLGKLDGVRPSGSGHSAKCPAHGDASPSLSTSVKNDRILVRCHRGCTITAITSTLGITTKDLFLDEAPVPTRTIAATYDYVTPDGGERVFQVVRLLPKGFRQRREDPTMPGQ